MSSTNQFDVVRELKLIIRGLEHMLEMRTAEVERLRTELRDSQSSVTSMRRKLNTALLEIDELQEKMEKEKNKPPEVLVSEVYRCATCAFEVIDGFCQGPECGLEHTWPPAKPLPDDNSISTTIHALHADRSLQPRDNTPLLENIELDLIPPVQVKKHGRFVRVQSPYNELLRRGATRLMCETFHLEFSYEEGIYAWADWDIFRDFADPRMQEGDFWMIHLGRRIQLDEDDLDGSAFIEDLLEEALVFPLHSSTCKRKYEKWATFEESPGIWLTRLEEHVEYESDLEDEEFDSGDESSTDGDSDVSEHDCWAPGLSMGEDVGLGNPSGPLNVYSSDIEMEVDNTKDSDSEEDAIDSDELSSDTDDAQFVHHSLLDPTGPDGPWTPQMEDDELLDTDL